MDEVSRGAIPKLDQDDERKVVRLYWQKRYPVKVVALAAGISKTAVYDIVRRHPEWKPANARRRA